jgi:hypothetical protein
MSHRILVWFATLSAICASSVLASAQVTSSPTEIVPPQSTSGPVAYIYVSSLVSNTKYQVVGYEAATNGTLTPIPGSPFADNINWLALNGAWLFGVDPTGTHIDSFSIGSNGALTYKDKYTTNLNGGTLYDLFLDHTGASLYAIDYTTNNDYLSQSVNQETGQLSFLNDLSGGPDKNVQLSFIGNNKFAYASSCYHYTNEIFGVERASNGTLSYLNISPPFPAEKSGGFYCPWAAAADPTNHLAIALTPLNSNWGSDGPTQLAVYTADSAGNLTTTSTYQNMPSVSDAGCSNLLDVSNGQVPGGGRGRIADLPFQRREPDHALYGLANDRHDRSGLLGQRQSLVCDQPKRRQVVCIQCDVHGSDAGFGLATQNPESGKFDRASQVTIAKDKDKPPGKPPSSSVVATRKGAFFWIVVG